MNTEATQPSFAKRAWSRRWVRRLTYVLATGGVITALGAWALSLPYVDRLIVARLDEVIRKETGLAFKADSLEVHPWQGRLVLHRPMLGEDLFQAQYLEVELDFLSLLQTPHFRRIHLESPRINLDAGRLAAIHLREHPPAKEPARFRIDRVEVVDGQVFVNEPAWGINRGTFDFKVDGRGRLVNQVWLDVRVPRMAMGEGPDRTRGDMSLKFRYTDKGIDTANVQVHLGDNALAVLGSYEFATHVIKADVSGGLDLAEALRLVPRAPGTPRPAATPVSGFLDFKGKVQGPPSNAVWNVAMDGRQIQAKGTPLHAGTFHASAAGSPSHINLERIAWDSADGRVTAQGSWSHGGGTALELNAEGVSLAPAVSLVHMEMLRGLTAHFHGTASFPTPPWAVPDLEKVKVAGQGQFLKEGQKVGTVEFSVADKRLRADALDLQLPEAGFHGTASALLNRRGIASVEAEGDVRTDAHDVAGALRAWKITDLDMSGPTTAHAAFQWDPQGGIQVDGQVKVDGPRWHGAHADSITAGVSLRRDVIRVTDIELVKGEGHGSGEIWITWAPDTRDQEGIDMCFRAFRLPVNEGLRAADKGDLEINGTGSGWARLHGPLRSIVMEGQAVAENGVVYGLTIPAVSGSFFMDINSLRLQATDIRVADSLDHLEGKPGPLNLHGSMDMDAKAERWTTRVEGDVDTSFLGIKGPLLRGRLEGRLDGPITAPLGPSQAPEGRFTLTGGFLSMSGRSLEGLEAALTFKDGHLDARAGLAGREAPVVTFQAVQVGKTRLSGDLQVHIAPDSAETAALSSKLTQGFLKDLGLDYRGRGDWTPSGLTWKGQMDRLVGTFEGFELAQTRPSTFTGDLKGMALAMEVEGRTLTPNGVPSPNATRMGLSGNLPFALQGDLDLRLEGASELANLKAILDHLVDPGQYSLMADMRPAGTASFDLHLGGKPAEPALDGTLRLSGGRLSERTYPQSIENVDFVANFHGRDVTIPQDAPLRGILAQGALTAWGRITWGFKGLTDYDLSATLEDFQFRDLPEGFEIQGGFSGSLRGNDRDGGLLKGTIRAKNMLYQTDINLTDIILAGALGGAGGALTSMDPSDPLARIELDLDLQLARPWEFDTNLLKLQGRPTGAFRIKGSLAHPGLKGRMDLLPGGRLTNLVPAGDVVLERGSVEFTDPAVFNPIVDLHGRIDVDPYLVTLDINGTLDAINAHPTSTPALRADEIFAILVDPSAVNKVGGSQGAPAQNTVSTGVFNQGAGLLSSLFLANGLERLRKTLTLDRVNFAILGGPNLSLTLEKSFDILGHRTPLIYNYKQEGTQTTISGNVEWRFGNLVLQLGARQVTGTSQTPGDTTVQGVQPSGEIRYTWTPK